ncbi:Nuclear pore complex protein Nup50 [Liparis tanakae]|uniref:Nuclear pore complex protein Nup50 n=1 Tax=Liparis tanakae TaxID=230148 RepID=A0A4Z2F440_9TELE|nr:Nuclear pore complex protein Nup50 [Liparis tanakae]
MAKRIADKELTDRNWDQVEEEEEAGSFLVASEDVLKSRPIKKAKRRAVGEADGGASFKGFKGFSLSGASAPTAFSGFGNGGGFTGLNGSSGAAPFSGFSSPAAAATPGEDAILVSSTERERVTRDADPELHAASVWL